MFYEPVQTERFFNEGQLYSSIDWDDFRVIVTAWDRRIRGWYIDPVEVMLSRDVEGLAQKLLLWWTKRPNPGHYAFTVLSISCLLIDALSQYRFGKLKSTGDTFRKFIEDCLPSYGGTLSTNTWHYDHAYNTNGRLITKHSEALWNGFRCGILHQAHAPLNCGVIPGNSPPTMEPTNHAQYGPSAGNAATVVGSNCPVVVLRPEHLFDEITDFLDGYVRDLIDPASRHDGLRDDFKKKFTDSFGVDIAGASL